MSQQNDISYKFKKKSWIEWQETAERFYLISNQLIRMEKINLSESTLIELTKLNVNSFLFKEYMASIDPMLEEDKDGYLDLTDLEVSNIWKCLSSLTESKKVLLKSSISVEVH